MDSQRGFTVIEIIVVVIFLTAAGILFAIQRNDLAAAQRDDIRKIAINSMYYNLEEVYYKENGFYPLQIQPGTLSAMDQDLLTDPTGKFISDIESEYRYEPTGCTGEQCTSYTLRADLEREGDFVRESLR